MYRNHSIPANEHIFPLHTVQPRRLSHLCTLLSRRIPVSVSVLLRRNPSNMHSNFPILSSSRILPCCTCPFLPAFRCILRSRRIPAASSSIQMSRTERNNVTTAPSCSIRHSRTNCSCVLSGFLLRIVRFRNTSVPQRRRHLRKPSHTQPNLSIQTSLHIRLHRNSCSRNHFQDTFRLPNIPDSALSGQFLRIFPRMMTIRSTDSRTDK